MLTLAVAIGTFGVDLAQGATVAAVAPSEVQTEPAAATPNGVQLKGKLNPGNAPTTYWFVYKDTATECEEELGCGPTTAVGGPLEGGTQQEVPPLEVTGLTPGATYRYWLVAVNAKGAVRGPELTFTTPADEEPSGVQTQPAMATANGFALKGSLNAGDMPTTYWFVYTGTGTECEELLGCGPTTAVGGPLTGDAEQEVPPLEVTGLTPGATYRYWLVAVNAKGAARGGELTFVAAPSSPASASGPSSNGPALNAPLGSQSVSAPSAASSPWGGAAASALSGAAPKSTPRKKLSAALRVCEKKPKVRRAACARQARKRYAAVAKKSGYR